LLALGTTNIPLLTELPANPSQNVKEQMGEHIGPPREDFSAKREESLVRHYPHFSEGRNRQECGFYLLVEPFIIKDEMTKSK
jgi:hypothetical protein